MGLYERIDQLKKANPKLKTLLAIGKEGLDIEMFSKINSNNLAL